MFASHQPLIAAHAQTPQGFADVVTFAICTMNQHFYRVGAILKSLKEDGLEDAKYLNASQKRGIAFVRAHAAAFLSLPPDDLVALRALVELPSIGIVKAGLILQCCAGRTGCLDRHNLRLLGLSERAFQRVPQSTEALSLRLALYIKTCALLGTSQDLWDGWCHLIAAKYPRAFVDAEDVSAKHVEWITGQSHNVARKEL